MLDNLDSGSSSDAANQICRLTSLLPMEDQGFDGKAPNYLLYLYVPPSRLSIKLNIAVSNAGFARLGQNDLNIL